MQYICRPLPAFFEFPYSYATPLPFGLTIERKKHAGQPTATAHRYRAERTQRAATENILVCDRPAPSTAELRSSFFKLLFVLPILCIGRIHLHGLGQMDARAIIPPALPKDHTHQKMPFCRAFLYLRQEHLCASPVPHLQQHTHILEDLLLSCILSLPGIALLAITSSIAGAALLAKIWRCVFSLSAYHTRR